MFTDEMIASISRQLLQVERRSGDDVVTGEQIETAVRAWLESVAEALTEEPAWYLYGPSMDGRIRPKSYFTALDRARRAGVPA